MLIAPFDPGVLVTSGLVKDAGIRMDYLRHTKSLFDSDSSSQTGCWPSHFSSTEKEEDVFQNRGVIV